MSIVWTPALKERFAALYTTGATLREMQKAIPGLNAHSTAGQSTRMNLHRPPRPDKVIGLSVSHPAVVIGETKFPTRVRSPRMAPAVLTPGKWQRKLGSVISKGAWRDYPVYALTLEERATCPSSCHHWQTCMGNGMQAAWRHRHGTELEMVLGRELVALQRQHPGGFVVRLHILGDFYSVSYVRRWSHFLDAYPALHVFGYTAWPPETKIGAAVAELSAQRWGRFAVRLSAAEAGPARAITLWQYGETPQIATPYATAVKRYGTQRAAAAGIGVSLGKLQRGLIRENKKPMKRPEAIGQSFIVCPAQTGRTQSCSSCALCWAPAARDKTIAFVAHGR